MSSGIKLSVANITYIEMSVAKTMRQMKRFLTLAPIPVLGLFSWDIICDPQRTLLLRSFLALCSSLIQGAKLGT